MLFFNNLLDNFLFYTNIKIRFINFILIMDKLIKYEIYLSEKNSRRLEYLAKEEGLDISQAVGKLLTDKAIRRTGALIDEVLKGEVSPISSVEMLQDIRQEAQEKFLEKWFKENKDKIDKNYSN